MHTLFRRNDKIGVSTDADTPPKNNLISITALNGYLWMGRSRFAPALHILQ